MNKDVSDLLQGVEPGQQELIEGCLAGKSHDMNQRGLYGRTAIMEAAARGHLGLFEALLSAGADISLTDEDDNGLLILAVLGHQPQIVQRLLDEGLNLEGQGHKGRTAVMVAIAEGDVPVFELLARRGASLTLADADGNSCMHLAAKSGNASLVKMLLQQGKLDINAHKDNGQTPVMITAFEGGGEVFELLVSAGADLSLVDGNNNDCLMLAVFSGQTSMVDQVLKTGRLDVNRKGEKGMTPAMMAASFGAKADFDLLLGSGANMTLKNDFDNDFLFWAASGGNVEIVKYLLSLKTFDVNRKQEHGLTPLHIAITKGHEAVYDFLVSNGADISLKNDQMYNSLMIASHTGNMALVKKLLSIDADINGQEENGWTPLMIAAKCGHTELFDLLLASGADSSRTDKDSNNCLMLASIYSKPLMVQHLVDRALYDVDCRGMYGWTPAMSAANEGHAEVFDVLVKGGADVNLLDDSSNNCLILASLGGNVDIVHTLVAMEVLDLDYKGHDGSAIMAALAEGHDQVVDLLIRNGADTSHMQKDIVQ